MRVTRDWGFSPRWSRGGRELIYQHGHDVMAVDIGWSDAPTPGMPRVLSRMPSRGEILPFYWASEAEMEMSADGERALSSTATQDEPLDVKAILNWTRLVER